MALLYQDLVKAQQGMSRDDIANEANRLVPIGGSSSGYAPLPGIAPNGQATYSPAQGAGDPITNFNLQLLTMLQQAQQGVNNAPLYDQANNLQNQQVVNSMAPASQLGIDNLRPGDALNARQNQGNLYNPEINALNDRIRLNNETIGKFEKAVDTAMKFGETYAKTLKPDEATIQAIKDQMAAGFEPSASIIDKIGKYLTADDWNALAQAQAASKQTSSKPSQTTENIGGTAYRITYDEQGNVINKVALGPSGDPDKPSSSDQKEAKRNSIIAEAKKLPRGQNNFANPNDYLEKASEYIQADGSVNDFIAAVIPSLQLSPSDAEWVRSELNRAQPNSGGGITNPFK